MTVDIEAQELKVGDKVLVEMQVTEVVKSATGKILVALANDEHHTIAAYHPTQTVEIHT